jgi:molybdate transport system substrate-binding protein
MGELHVLSAGAAKGLVEALAPALLRRPARRCAANSGGRRDAGTPAERRALRCAIILTAAMLDALTQERPRRCEHRLTARPRAYRYCGACRRRCPTSPIAPDWAEPCCGDRPVSTRPRAVHRGVHCMKVLRQLDIDAVVASRCARFPMAPSRCASSRRSREHGLVGCTQITEIRYTQGVTLVGPCRWSSIWPRLIRWPSQCPRDFPRRGSYACTNADRREFAGIAARGRI